MKHLLVVFTIALLASTSFAQEEAVKEKKAKKMLPQIKKVEKLLSNVELSTEQSEAFKAASMTLTEELKMVKGKGLTKDLMKMREAKRKEGRASGMKWKELIVHEMEGLSEEEAELFKSFDKTVSMFEKSVANILTPEQIAEMPEKAQSRIKAMMAGNAAKGKQGRKGKKKMEAESDDSGEE